MKTWKDLHGVSHVVQEEDVGYTDPLYEWVPLCHQARAVRPYVRDMELLQEKPTCLRCIRKSEE